MRAADAAVLILDKDGATQALGLPGATTNPSYSAMRAHGGIRHVLAGHVKAASHMAEGYTGAAPGNIGLRVPVVVEVILEKVTNIAMAQPGSTA